MHKKLAKAGVTAVSVCLLNDDDKADDIRAKALKFLRGQKAAFPNFVLDEQPAVWQARLGFDGPPAVFVFNREGKIAQKFTGGVNHEDVEKLVVELLKE
jgi:hypothetical protein